MKVFGARNYADPLKRFLVQETDTFYQFLAEIIKVGQHDFWPQKQTLWVSFWAQKRIHFVNFWSQLFWPIEKEKNDLKMLWIMWIMYEQEKSI